MQETHYFINTVMAKNLLDTFIKNTLKQKLIMTVCCEHAQNNKNFKQHDFITKTREQHHRKT